MRDWQSGAFGRCARARGLCSVAVPLRLPLAHLESFQRTPGTAPRWNCVGGLPDSTGPSHPRPAVTRTGPRHRYCYLGHLSVGVTVPVLCSAFLGRPNDVLYACFSPVQGPVHVVLSSVTSLQLLATWGTSAALSPFLAFAGQRFCRVSFDLDLLFFHD